MGLHIPAYFHNGFSPKSASAKVSNRAVPNMGHFGLTQVNGLRKANSKTEPRLGKSATLELDGTLATQRRKESSAGSSNTSKSLRQSRPFDEHVQCRPVIHEHDDPPGRDSLLPVTQGHHASIEFNQANNVGLPTLSPNVQDCAWNFTAENFRVPIREKTNCTYRCMRLSSVVLKGTICKKQYRFLEESRMP